MGALKRPWALGSRRADPGGHWKECSTTSAAGSEASRQIRHEVRVFKEKHGGLHFRRWRWGETWKILATSWRHISLLFNKKGRQRNLEANKLYKNTALGGAIKDFLVPDGRGMERIWLFCVCCHEATCILLRAYEPSYWRGRMENCILGLSMMVKGKS